VATVFVTEHPTGESRTLELLCAGPARCRSASRDSPFAAPRGRREGGGVPRPRDPAGRLELALPDSNPLCALLRVTINAILYATSAGIQPEVRRGPTEAAQGRRGGVP
jgi:hypothetical protein